MRKCILLDCPWATIDNKKDFCATHQDWKEKEGKTCEACGNPESEQNSLILGIDFAWRAKKSHALTQKLRVKVPTHLQTEIDQIALDLKLSTQETKLIDESEQLVNNFLAESGGKRRLIDKYHLCSICSQKLEEKGEEFASQNPNIKILGERIKKAQEKMNEIAEKTDQELSADQWEEITTELNEELYGRGDSNPDPSSPNPPQKDNDEQNTKTRAWCGKSIKGGETFGTFNRLTGQNSYYCSKTCQEGKGGSKSEAAVARLNQEINSLKQEIQNLKNSQNTTPSDSSLLNQKEQELKNKENDLKKELDKQKGKNQPSQNNDGLSRALIIAFSIAGGGDNSGSTYYLINLSS